MDWVCNTPHTETACSYEVRRLQALQALEILDTPPDPSFDDIVGLAQTVFNVPIVLISLVDAERQWFKANVGLEPVTETPREFAFCDHTIRDACVMVVEDATQDARFAKNPLVTGDPNIRFYAGAPLKLDDGHTIGTICLIDKTPKAFSDVERRQLEGFASLVLRAIQARDDSLKHRKSVEELNHWATLNEAILEGSDHGILYVEPVFSEGNIINFAIIRANAVNFGPFSLKPEDLVGKNVTEIFPALIKEEVHENYLHVFRTGKTLKNVVKYKTKGLADWFQYSIVKTGISGLTVNYKSISQQKVSQHVHETLNELATTALEDITAYKSAMLDFARNVLGFEAGVLSQVLSSHVVPVAVSGPLENVKIGQPIPIEDTLAAIPIALNRAVTAPAASDYRKRFTSSACAQFKDYAGAPIYVNGVLKEVVCLVSFSPRARPVEDWELDLVQIFACSIGRAMELGEAAKKTEYHYNQLQLVLDNIPASVVFKDANGKVLRANAHAVNWYGKSKRSDVEGHYESDLLPQHAEMFRNEDIRAIESGTPLLRIKRKLHLGKNDIWVSANKAPMKDDEGNDYLVIVTEDISDLQKREDELNRLNKSLANFTSVAAHDLRAPLKQASAFLELFQDDVKTNKTELSSDAFEFLSYVNETLENASELVTDLYDLFKLEQHKIHIDDNVDLQTLVEDSLQSQPDVLENASINIDLGSLPRLNLSKRLIHQLFSNLFANAHKYGRTPALNVDVFAEYDAVKELVDIYFQDQGRGIPTDKSDFIFEPFKRLESLEGIEGSGIGLALCRRIAAMHDGNIRVDETYRKGARLVLTLPV